MTPCPIIHYIRPILLQGPQIHPFLCLESTCPLGFIGPPLPLTYTYTLIPATSQPIVKLGGNSEVSKSNFHSLCLNTSRHGMLTTRTRRGMASVVTNCCLP